MWVSVTGLGFVVAVVQSSYGSQAYSEPVQSHSWVGGGYWQRAYFWDSAMLLRVFIV